MHSEIEYRSNLSYADFRDNYLFPNKPVIVTDVMRKWSALSRWSPDFFKTEFGDLKFTLDVNVPGDRKRTEPVQYTMSRFIDQVQASTDEKPAPYFRNRILDQVFPSLRRDIEPLPDYFFPNWLPEPYLMKNVQRVFNRGSQIEIYIGGKGGAFPMLHYDGLASHAFLMQIHGRKKFILFGPEQEQYMYAPPDQPNISQIVEIERPDLTKFPLFAKAIPTTFILEPGELLFIPSKWWHTTKMLTPSISISANIVNRSNWPALTDFVCTKREPLVRAASRVYLSLAGSWRAKRDQRLTAIATSAK